MTVKIRTASPSDKTWVVDVAARKMLEDEVQRPDMYNPADCGNLFDLGCSQGLILVADTGTELVGCIAGVYCANMFNTKLITLQEIFWYVLPDYRNSRAGLLLLNEFCDIGRETSNDVHMSLLDRSPVNQRILERKGFTFKEMAFHMKGNLSWQR